MPTDPALRNALPAQARLAYDKSDLPPTALRLKFGPQLRMDVPEGTEPYAPAPVTALGREIAEHAQRCQNTWTLIRDAHFRSLADKSVDHTTAFVRSAKAAKVKLGQLDANSQRLLADLDARTQHIATLQANARKPPTSVGEAQIDAEVRAMIRAEADPNKAAALARAHPRALATAPAVALGLSDDSPLYREAINAHLRATIPDVMAEADELSAAIDQFTRADKAVVELSRSIIDFDLAANLESGANWDAAA